MLRIATLASGSSGNCTVVSDGSRHVLIDAGISCRRILEGLTNLEINPVDLSAILITHEHTDHIGGLTNLLKKIAVPIYAPEPTLNAMMSRVTNLKRDQCWTFAPGECFALEDLIIETFANSHDAASPVGYTITSGDRKMGLCTDTGVITQAAWKAIKGCGVFVGEMNHDIPMLQKGPYPAMLKARILGDKGHLCNEVGAQLAVHAAESGCRHVLMAHLSEENNTPELAMAAAEKAFQDAGAVPGEDVLLTIAPRHASSGWLEVPSCNP